MESEERIVDDGTSRADHLCVLIHGLWGSPGHMQYIATALRDKYGEDDFHILIPKTNSGNYTYDGVDLGGERVTHEIEVHLEELQKAGKQIKKLSVVGYSLGGLVARYAIGLLYSRGWFEKLEPVNFTALASPHLGVRSPGTSFRSRAYNYLGANTLSVSGQQLFITDAFRDTGRPLLSVLADPTSVFMTALSKFPHRVLYANIVNDRSVPYFTGSICTTDPFTDLDTVKINYLRGYEPNILDPKVPVPAKVAEDPPSLLERLKQTGYATIKDAPSIGLFSILFPIAFTVLLGNTAIQAVRSQQRIKLHEEGKAGISLGSYRNPFLIENAREAMEGAIGNLAPSKRITDRGAEVEKQHLLPPSDSDPDSETSSPSSAGLYKGTAQQLPLGDPLALTSSQLDMIDSLDTLGFKKYRVHIHRNRHSHAAIIVRQQWRKGFVEGKVMVRHWLDEEFVV